MKERRKAIQLSLRSITIDELKRRAKEHQDDFVDDPSRENFLRLVSERPDASFYHALFPEGAIVLYCAD